MKSYTLLILLVIMTCRGLTEKHESKAEKYELTFKEHKNDLSKGICTVLAEVKHTLPDGTVKKYTLQSVKNTCEEAEADIRKGFEALKKN